MPFLDAKWNPKNSKKNDKIYGGDPEGAQRKFLINSSDEETDDDEWIQQLERDYGKRHQKKQKWKKWSRLEKVLLACLLCSILLLTLLLTAFFYSRHKHGETFVEFALGGQSFCNEKGCVEASHRVMNYMDEKNDPCNSLYDFACGKWINSAEIPLGQSRRTSFREVSDNNLMRMKHILDNLKVGDEDSTALKKVFKYYHACLDQDFTEKHTNASVIDLINYVGSWAITNSSSWNGEQWNFGQALTRIHHLKSMPLFYMYVATDDKNSSKNVIQIEQSGVTLADESYYNKPDTHKIIQSYKKMMVDAAILLGSYKEEAQKQMEEVYQFEKKIASIYEKKDTQGNPDGMYHRITVGHLQSMCPAIPWMDYMNNMYTDQVKSEEEVIVYNPNYLKNMSDLVIQTERRIIANYMVWHLIKPMLPMMSRQFRSVAMEMKNKETGAKATEDSWKSCVAKTDSVLGFATGHLFVKDVEAREKFSRNEVERMLQLIKEAFLLNIPKVPWMDTETKAKAYEKARAIIDMVGYPQWIKSKDKLDRFYENLTVTDNPFTNYLQAREFYHERTMQRRGKRAERTEWHMTPTEVNAYYNSPNNYIAFPVGILQPPFYDSEFPMAINFGAIGTVIGHELTHGFDIQGRHFDKDGNMQTWWTNKSTDGFINNTKCLEKQYNRFAKEAGLKETSKRNLAEDIADNGGLKIAYQAFKAFEYLNGAGKLLPGLKLPHEQMFFVGFAQVWCAKSTEEKATQMALLDRHSPERMRVDVAAANADSYSRAFLCPKGSRMNPKERCSVW